MYCPETRVDATAPAYAVTCSFAGAPLAAEDIGARSTFTVYFRPEELAPEIRAALSARKGSGRNLASHFALSTKQERVERVVIDDAASKLCEDRLIDGALTHTDAACRRCPSGIPHRQSRPGAASVRASSEGMR